MRQMQRLFVSNLPLTVGTVQLKKYVFENFGKVFNVDVIFNKETGVSQQYGFLTVPQETLLNLEKTEKHHLEGNQINFKVSER